MGIVSCIIEQYDIARFRGWEKLYWAIDLHNTLIFPTYGKMEASDVVYYPNACDVMKLLSDREDTRLIMYTCSWPQETKMYRAKFLNDGISFDWVNENPEVDQTKYGYYQEKPYFNVLLDDKAGFKPATDWGNIGSILNCLPLLDGKPVEG